MSKKQDHVEISWCCLLLNCSCL